MKKFCLILLNISVISISPRNEGTKKKNLFKKNKNYLKKIEKPVIGLFGNSNPENDDTNINSTYYAQTYVYWLEEFGAEVMAIHHWYSYEELDIILKKVNGVLFMGGGRDFRRNGTWEKKAKYIMDYALISQLPVWGTCQGLQIIGTIISDNYTLLVNEFNHVNVLDNVILKSKVEDTKMYTLFKENDVKILTEEDSTIYYHTFAFYPNDWNNDKNLTKYFIVTGEGTDTDGKYFVNSFEGISSGENKNMFFGTQYHPEKNPYKRYNYYLNHETNALKVSQLLGMQFVQKLRDYQKDHPEAYFDEDERQVYDFFYTYTNKTRAQFNYEGEEFIFYKKK